jgi:hypothetical protein
MKQLEILLSIYSLQSDPEGVVSPFRGTVAGVVSVREWSLTSTPGANTAYPQ